MISNHAPSATRTTLHYFIIAINSGCQTRTDDNLINSQVLYQLSYAGITHQHKILYHVDKSLQTIILNFIYQNY